MVLSIEEIKRLLADDYEELQFVIAQFKLGKSEPAWDHFFPVEFYCKKFGNVVQYFDNRSGEPVKQSHIRIK